jgi:hypothetical protein
MRLVATIQDGIRGVSRILTVTAAGLLFAMCGSVLAEERVKPDLAEAENASVFDVRNYGAKGDGSSDDSAAVAAAAKAAAGAAATGRAAMLYFPSGVYRLVAALPTWTVAVGVVGDGHAQSVVSVDPAFSGDVFAWSGVRGEPDERRGDERGAGGIAIVGIRIVGNRTTANLQSAFAFYDHIDHVVMRDVDVFYMTGHALSAGARQRAATASLQRSEFNSLRFFNCGSSGVPVVDIGAAGVGAATDEVGIDSLDIYAPYGTGVVVHGEGSPVRNIRFSKLRIEGLQNGTIAADLLQVGDATLDGPVSSIWFDQTELIDPYAGHAALRLAAPTLSAVPRDVYYQGMIGGGLPNGKGIVIDAGSNLFFDLRGIHTFDLNVVVASSATVAGPIVMDGHGQENSWTRAVDPSSAANVTKPVLQQF